MIELHSMGFRPDVYMSVSYLFTGCARIKLGTNIKVESDLEGVP